MSNLAPAVDNAVKIIEALAYENEAVGVSELSRKVDINKNMIFRVLNTLEENGWVYCENPSEKKYRLTLQLFKIASKSVNKLSLNAIATPKIQELWKKTGESTYLGILSEDKVMYIQHFDGTGDVRVAGRVGGRYDLYCSAPGKVLLAYSDDEIVENYLKKDLKKRTEHTITKKEELLKELKNVKKNGYATDKQEFGNGITCVAAPIFDYSGNIAGVVGCSAFTVDGNSESVIDRLLDDVIKTAKEISACLGTDI